MTEATSSASANRLRIVAVLLLLIFVADRLLLLFGQPDLLHDLDPGELKHMTLATSGLPDQGSLRESIRTWVSGPENIHHGGFPVVSILFAGIAKITGPSLHALRMIPVLSAFIAALLLYSWLRRQGSNLSAVLCLALLVGAPLLFLKWTCVARGGHTEAVLFAPLMLLSLERALQTSQKRFWFFSGLVGGFAVYFSYLAIPLVLVLSFGALLETLLRSRPRVIPATLTLGVGGIVGFGPWLTGWLVLDLPYLEATIHASANPNEASEVLRRGVLGALNGAVQGLPHNLWPWSFSPLQSAAYQTDPSDLLPYSPTLLDWLGRGLMAVGGMLTLVASFVRRSPLLGSLALLPALHYLFVARLANAGAWPDIPHRYLVLVFPIAAASTAFGVGWLVEKTHPLLRRVGWVLVAAVLGLSLLGLGSHFRWLKAPQPQALEHWEPAAYQVAGIGQVRLQESQRMSVLLTSFEGPLRDAYMRGVGRIFRPNSDYYLLWKTPENRDVPYPTSLFFEPDPLTPPDERDAVVEGAYGASRVRAGEDEQQLDAWLCSWQPSAEFQAAVSRILEKHKPRLSCLGAREEPASSLP